MHETYAMTDRDLSCLVHFNYMDIMNVFLFMIYL
ncbi:unnamed protein product [Spirodela intermedia]|uniref:Uncharacterized protein n=2 Tax=Spirodela intermedia TaxID=51605 RepID=A0A7I8IN80_SPIIN|nr:unnamed protein product [Spirodela intermedia]CAA6658912.1 unnamed protein product [Spirodela intermedia]CAA7395196.1 unnamed protein product [Spirodela intermedia]